MINWPSLHQRVLAGFVGGMRGLWAIFGSSFLVMEISINRWKPYSQPCALPSISAMRCPASLMCTFYSTVEPYTSQTIATARVPFRLAPLISPALHTTHQPCPATMPSINRALGLEGYAPTCLLGNGQPWHCFCPQQPFSRSVPARYSPPTGFTTTSNCLCTLSCSPKCIFCRGAWNLRQLEEKFNYRRAPRHEEGCLLLPVGSW